MSEGNSETAGAHEAQHGKVVNPVIFSRQSTLHGPDIDEKLAETDAVSAAAEVEQNQQQEGGSHKRIPTAVRMLIHQTDKDGVHQRHSNSEESPPEIAQKPSLWSRLCCCLCTSGYKEPQDSDTKTPSASEPVIASPRTSKKPGGPWLLGEVHHEDAGKKCLVLDLDETLVHSSFQHVSHADYVIPVKIENAVHSVFVLKRPGVDEFITEMAKYYEIVVYTASLNKYADPLLDQLDTNCKIRWRLFRESCVFHEGHYVKDLSLLDRNLASTIIIDNSAMSYMFHPENAIGCTTFIDDPDDYELLDIAEFLKHIHQCEDVRDHCRGWKEWCRANASRRKSSSCNQNRQVNF